MPVYVYHCDACDFQFEQQQKFSDNPLKECPSCGKIALHKVYTPVGIIYKGSGFYSTDHRSSSGAVSSASHKKDDAEKTEKEKPSPKKETAKTTSEKSSAD